MNTVEDNYPLKYSIFSGILIIYKYTVEKDPNLEIDCILKQGLQTSCLEFRIQFPSESNLKW